MTLRVLLVVGIVIAAVIAAWALERNRASRSAPVTTAAPIPGQVDRNDFARPGADWLLVMFSSAACESCSAMADRIAPLAAPDLAVDDVDFAERPALHEKYGIEAVPVVGLFDSVGVAHARFVGPTPAAELWSAIARARDSQDG